MEKTYRSYSIKSFQNHWYNVPLKFILPADVLLTIYNSLILLHFNYCHLAWGSNITAGHKLHLLQKKAVRIVDHRHFLAHTEPICKRLRIVKIVDMFQISIWKFYYKLMNNMLPSYFEYMKPVQPVACIYYGIRKPRLHPPIINHEMVQYCLIKILNEDNHETTLNKNNIYSQSFLGMGRNRYRVLEVSDIGSILKYRYRRKIRYRYRVLFDTISILFRYFTSTDILTLSCNEKKYKDY